MTWTRQEFLADVVRTGILSAAYADDVLVRLAHHSAAIEGNTLTLADTITMLDTQDTPALTRLLAVSLADEASRRDAT